MKQIDLIKDTHILFTLINECYQLFPNHFDVKKSKSDITKKLLKYKFIDARINICEYEIYYYIIQAFEKFALEINRHYNFESFRIFLTRNEHHHKFTPMNQYLGVCIEFYDARVLQLRIKLSPYIGEFNCYEVGTSIRLCKSSRYSWVFKKYNVLFDLIKKKIPITNLNPGTVYMYVLDSAMYDTHISQISSQYNADKINLQKYCDDMNSHIPDLNLTFNDDYFYWNRRYKLKKVSDQTQNIIPFPKISSFIYGH